MMTRTKPKQRFNFKQDIEYFSVVNGIVDVFILVGGRQPSIAGPLENDRIGVLQTRPLGHCVTKNTRLQITNKLFAENGYRR